MLEQLIEQMRSGTAVNHRMEKLMAVSYTHLDVYKRQLLHCAVFLELTASSYDDLKLLQPDVLTELVRSKLNVDQMCIRDRSRHKLTRSGITYIVQKYADMARETASGMPTKISPHIFRHRIDLSYV